MASDACVHSLNTSLRDIIYSTDIFRLVSTEVLFSLYNYFAVVNIRIDVFFINPLRSDYIGMKKNG